MPALATGFAAIAERLKMQKNILAQFNQALHQINATLDAILSQHDLQTSVRALNARRKHAILRQRCLALASKVQVLRNRGYALDKEEDDLKTKFDTLDRGISDPALSARTEELWSRLIMLRGYADSLSSEMSRRGPETQEGLGEEAEAKAKKVRSLGGIHTLEIHGGLTLHHRFSRTTTSSCRRSSRRSRLSRRTTRSGRRRETRPARTRTSAAVGKILYYCKWDRE